MKKKSLYQIRLLLALLLPLVVTHKNQLGAQVLCIDPAQIDSNALCPDVYDPVCGCDGITYGNSCDAMVAGVTHWSPGTCSSVNDCADLQVGFSAFVITHAMMVAFTDESSSASGQILSWHWDFGDGSTSDVKNPNHLYPFAGVFVVCLSVKVADANGLVCEETTCRSVTIPVDCADNCFYGVQVELDGVAVHAELSPALADTPFFFYVLWSLDDGAATGNGLEFNQLLMEPGRHKICASYPTGDFSPDFCTVCRAFEVDAVCIDTAQIDSVACPLAYIPVCGCDGVTYNNSCEAYNWAGVTAWKPGVCGSVCNNLSIDFEGFNSGGSLTVWTFNDRTFFPGGQVTSWFWDFSNGYTSNEQNPTLNFGDPGEYQVCLFVSGQFADGTQCGTSLCRTIVVPEKLCVDPNVIDLNVSCPAIYLPVCGCDGNTYENECVAYYHHGVTQWSPGPCTSPCINPSWIDTLAPCIEIYDPVCGCDGQTYQNDCFAMTHGVSSWKKGVCCLQQTCQANFSTLKLPGMTVLLDDLSVNAESWHVTFGDGQQYSGGFDSLYHTYTAPGVYQICLEISNFAGTCTDVFCTTVNIGSTSGTGQPQNAITCLVQPNPTRDFFTVKTPDAVLEQAILLDAFGKMVTREAIAGHEAGISVENLPTGLYFLTIQTDQGAISRKIAVQR